MHLTAYLAGAAGLFIVYRGLRRDFLPSVALLTTLLCFGATSLYFAMSRAEFVAVGAFVIVAALTVETSRFKSPILLVLAWLAAALVPVVATHFQDHTSTSVFGVDGFFSLTPASYFALLGTFAYARRNPYWVVGSLGLLLFWIGFGTDLSAAVALLAPGLALVLEWVRRRPLVAVAPLVVFAILWNYWLMVQYTAGMIPKDAPVSFAAMVRQQADVHTRHPYIYPFAFPGNALFAWREGVPIERYDVLSAEPRRDDFELTLNRRADRFLLDGWGPPGANDAGAFRWIDAPGATLTFPLEPSAAGVTIDVIATARGEGPSKVTELIFEVNGHAIGRAEASPRAPTRAAFSIAAADVGRVLRAGYNRLSIVISGPHRIAIHRIRISPAS